MSVNARTMALWRVQLRGVGGEVKAEEGSETAAQFENLTNFLDKSPNKMWDTLRMWCVLSQILRLRENIGLRRFFNIVTRSKIILWDSIVALQIFNPDIFRIKHIRNLAPANVCWSKVMDQNNWFYYQSTLLGITWQTFFASRKCCTLQPSCLSVLVALSIEPMYWHTMVTRVWEYQYCS